VRVMRGCSEAEPRSNPFHGEAGGNVYDKYGTSNPIARRLMDGFLGRLDRLVERTGAREAHEVGCGEGELAIRLARRGLRVRGSDAFPSVLEEARRRAAAAGVETEFEARPVEALEPERDAAELVLCCEVLEHLDDPEHALDVLAELARPWLIASVPREPLWRGLNLARLAYVRELGNTPGHLNHWSKGEFVRFLTRRFEVVEVTTPLPWTMALCRTAT
jgi:SAM-dependent methyltransferase